MNVNVCFCSYFQETYYIPYSNDKANGIKAPARGKLIQYYHNIPRDLKKAGLKYQPPPP